MFNDGWEGFMILQSGHGFLHTGDAEWFFTISAQRGCSVFCKDLSVSLALPKIFLPMRIYLPRSNAKLSRRLFLEIAPHTTGQVPVFILTPLCRTYFLFFWEGEPRILRLRILTQCAGGSVYPWFPWKLFSSAQSANDSMNSNVFLYLEGLKDVGNCEKILWIFE